MLNDNSSLYIFTARFFAPLATALYPMDVILEYRNKISPMDIQEKYKCPHV